ncbi:AAA family ATPase [Amycolatopsis sp. lyj-23]|uniref:AAA family ATPase n=1 Tax=Amycolatopsis sp. lyj-23 TaxID=2789283 RepID=UPI00397D1C8C
MVRQRGGLIGRRSEVEALLEDSGSGPILLRGLPGSGKSAVLEEFNAVLAGRGVPVLKVSFSAGGPVWDRFGFRAVLTAVREQYDCFDTHPRLAHSLDDVSRLCTEDGYADPWTRFCLLHAMSTLFSRLSRSEPITVILDDLDRLPEPIPAAAAIHRSGHTVVASCRIRSTDPVTSLEAVFRQLHEVGPLTPEAASNLLRRLLRSAVAPETESAVQQALGPLWGNPGAISSTVASLRARGEIQVSGGLARLRNSETPVTVPIGHPVFDGLELSGEAGREVVLLAAGPDGLSVDDLPYVAGGGNGAKVAGRLVDSLVEAGVLDCDSSGTIRCRIPGVAAEVGKTTEDRPRNRLHRSIVERMLEDGDLLSVRPGNVARHVALAGREQPVRTDFAAILLDAERSLPDDSPARTRYLYAGWWHSEPGDGRAVRQTELVRHLVRVADYRSMTSFVADALDAGPGEGERAQLALGAVLAALHLGAPVERAVREHLRQCDDAQPVLRLADRWFAGEPVDPAGVSAALLPVWRRIGSTAPQPVRRARLGERRAALLADACAARDLAPVLAAVLGADYRIPERGRLAVFHRVRAGYDEGRWADALSAVAELENVEAVEAPVREHARLLAAEMCGWRGESREAAEWLAAVPEPSRLPHLRAWVEAALCHQAGADDEAFAAGRRAFRIRPASSADPGTSRLLLRLAWLAGHSDDPSHRRAVVDVAESHHQGHRTSRSHGVLALVRGLAGGDETEIRTAERLLRPHRDSELVLLRDPAARMPDSPHGWLRQSHASSPTGVGTEPATAVAGAATDRKAPEVLSDTESRIVELIRAGRTNRQIARMMRMSEKTVEKQLTRLFAKVGCRTRYGLAMAALRIDRQAIGA